MDQKGFSPAPTSRATACGLGKHTFAVKAVDQIGREDPTPATSKFKVKKKGKKKKK